MLILYASYFRVRAKRRCGSTIVRSREWREVYLARNLSGIVGGTKC